jgi:xanthine dehydrogenase molybdopterin-binding subunit B
MHPEELHPLQTRDAATESDLPGLDRELAVIGERLRRVDGTGKVTGNALYADDLAFPGMLHAKILRSPHARAHRVDR